MRNYYRVSLLSSLSCDWQIRASKQSCADRTKKMGGHIENTRGRKPTGNRSEKLLLYWYHIYHFYTHFFVCPIRCVWNAKRLVSIKLIDGMINANGFELINILWNAYMSQTVAAVEIMCTRCVDLAIFKSSQISLWSRGRNCVCSIWNWNGNWDLYASSFLKSFAHVGISTSNLKLLINNNLFSLIEYRAWNDDLTNFQLQRSPEIWNLVSWSEMISSVHWCCRRPKTTNPTAEVSWSAIFPSQSEMAAPELIDCKVRLPFISSRSHVRDDWSVLTGCKPFNAPGISH